MARTALPPRQWARDRTTAALSVVRQIEIGPQLIERADADVLVEAQVIADEVLENDANRAAHRLEIVVTQIDPIEQNAPFRRIIQPCEQLDERRLPGAVLANEGDALARMQAEVHMPQRPGVAAGVAKTDVFEHQSLAYRPGHLWSAGGELMDGCVSKKSKRSLR